ncbi:MAG: hypothetical protein M3203_10395 [Actinomycetota bacterium]|nr:hypothetical protein [Actinomycetota bacterium]
MAGAGVAGVVLGSVVLVTVVGGAGDETGVASSRRPAAPAVARTTVPPAPDVTYVPPSRDPFHQNVTVPRAPLSGQASSPAATQTSPAAPRTATTLPSNASSKANLELKSIAPDGSGTVRATIIVDGQSYSPAKGETFSHGYRLERIDGNCIEVSAQAARARMCAPATEP